ncbi:FGGY carbohydrate kinase domain-containing protein [Onthophagus taurus]|uniref:FGGY carbohydrate kinase domain-containing protein n=1 Tax=Onthophagus taurus TaxID=166361 RepID=UPI000C2058CF|nr:FGGY carbohydrate kinase domain-containing protein [Onthophagus taurus]
MPESYFIGVDVGTGSVRVGLFTSTGNSVKIAKKDINSFNPIPDHYEQSSEEIWAACLHCIKEVSEGIESENIRGIGFDATCSLVVLDKQKKPLSVSTTGNKNQNVILWLDHRAHKEAEEINELNHPVLKYVGGKISLEMQTPKLMWLKRNMKETCWDKAGYFFDLPDFLTFKATGSEIRSLCSLVCKWTYEASSLEIKGWNKQYFHQIGLEDLLEDQTKIGTSVLPPGSPIELGLNQKTALETGLNHQTPVGVSAIDAHAGGLGIIGSFVDCVANKFSIRLGLICGTSTCHMIVSENPIFVNGVWGPYYSAMIPGMWLNEGGQSATGKLIDHIINTHPATLDLKKKHPNKIIQQVLNDFIEEIAERKNLPSSCFLTKDFHVWPDFHGNRSPIADSTLKGMISGLQLGVDEEDLAITYLATLQSLAYGTKHILSELEKSGHHIEAVTICGGLSKNKLYVQLQSDVLSLPVIVPHEEEPVLLGAAILGACAANFFENIEAAIHSMAGKGDVVCPDVNTQDYHRKKYQVFLKMLEHQKEYKSIMS